MRLRSLLFCAVALTLAFACSKKNYTPESTTTTQPETPTPQPPAGDADEAVYKFNAAADKVVLSHEFRGAWLATVSGTDWPKTKLNSSAQKAELTKYLEGIADAGCNVVFFQVCSNMDALWPSKLLPWSSVLTGTEGIDPGYDPTAFAVEKAHQLGLEVLLEMHSEAELKYAELGPDMCGINNRNLGSFVTDVENSFRLAELLPKDAVKVSESGISNPDTVRALRQVGFKGFLIGENFMKTANPGQALNDFISRL